MAKRKLFIPDDKGYGTPFLSVYDLTNDIRRAHTLMLTGGSDVSPSYYGEVKRQGTYCHEERDSMEKELVEYAQSVGLPILGICRGAQFLCVAAGGKLVQHITGHSSGNHLIKTNEDKQHIMSTSHHQMMLLKGTEHELLAWTKGRSATFRDGYDEELRTDDHLYEKDKDCDPIEPEIVFFPKLNGLGIQGHPEWLGADHPTIPYLTRLVQERLL